MQDGAPFSPQNPPKPADFSIQKLNQQQRQSQAALLPLISDFVRRAGSSADELADRIRGVQRCAEPASGAALLEDGTAAYSGPTPAAQRIVASAIALPSTPATARIGKFLPGGTLELGKMLADPPGSTRSDKLLRGRFNGDSEQQPKFVPANGGCGDVGLDHISAVSIRYLLWENPLPPARRRCSGSFSTDESATASFAFRRTHLPAPDDFAALTPASPGPIYAGTIDLSNYFHALLMPAAFRPFFCLRVRV